jgi:hypothetical protein
MSSFACLLERAIGVEGVERLSSGSLRVVGMPLPSARIFESLPGSKVSFEPGHSSRLVHRLMVILCCFVGVIPWKVSNRSTPP